MMLTVMMIINYITTAFPTVCHSFVRNYFLLGELSLDLPSLNYTVRIMVVIRSYRNANGRGCCWRPLRAMAGRVTTAYDSRGKESGSVPSIVVREELRYKALLNSNNKENNKSIAQVLCCIGNSKLLKSLREK